MALAGERRKGAESEAAQENTRRKRIPLQAAASSETPECQAWGKSSGPQLPSLSLSLPVVKGLKSNRGRGKHYRFAKTGGLAQAQSKNARDAGANDLEEREN